MKNSYICLFKIHFYLLTTLFILITDYGKAQQIPSKFSAGQIRRLPYLNYTNQLAGSGIHTINGKNLPDENNALPYNNLKFSTKNLHKETSSRIFSSEIKTGYEEGNPIPLFVYGRFTKTYLYTLSDKKSVEVAAKKFLMDQSAFLSTINQLCTFKMSSYFQDELEKTHIKMQQYFNEIPVFANEVIVHFDKLLPEGFNGRIINIPSSLSITPAISNTNSLSTAVNDLKKANPISELSDQVKAFLNYYQPLTDLVIYTQKDLHIEPVLAWHHTIRSTIKDRWEYFVDAQTGKILNKYNSSPADGPATSNATDLNGQSRTVNSYQVGSTYYLIDATRTMYNAGASHMPDKPVGALFITDAKNTPGQNLYYVTSNNNTWPDKSSVSAEYNVGLAYEYYKTTHARNSLDGNGGTISSIINVSEQDGSGMDNAFWNGEFMLYGNGNVSFKPLAGSSDVAGHELTHGVTEKTANLVYQFQSGAMNESISDIFGCMVDREDWKMGEDIVKPQQYPSGALRDLQDPHNGATSSQQYYWQPAHMNEYQQYDEKTDNGGVHVNSGIVNKAFYLFATAVTKEKAEKVYYRALTVYLTRSSQFIDLRLAVVKACDDLFGTNSNEGNQAKTAFDAVGITDGSSSGGAGNLPANPGEQRMLASSVSTQDPNGIYVVTNPLNAQNNDFHPISSLRPLNKPSVTDDGSAAVLVANDNKPYLISLNYNNPEQVSLDNSANWYNIAVSKDGNRIALISNQIDTSIYIYDFISKQAARYILYNPTTGQGAQSSNVLFADALEWDYSGEYLVYDAYNQVKNNTGDTTAYYDVNFIHVWDNRAKNFSSGKIYKLYSDLPEGVSIGNPSFSKLSPYILSFDYVDFDNQNYKVIGGNIETNDIGIIYDNNTIIGTPSYTIDDKVGAFSAEDDQQNYVIAGINLNQDKITSTGQPGILVSGGYFPVFYGTGKRVIQGLSTHNSTTEIIDHIYPNPFNNELYIDMNLHQPSILKIDLVNIYGQLIRNLETGKQIPAGVYKETINMEGISSGIYFLKCSFDHSVETRKIIHQ